MKYNHMISVILVSALFLFSCDLIKNVVSNEAFIKSEADKMKKKLPIKVDANTTLSDIEPGKDQINFIYDVTGIDADSVDDQMIRKAKSRIISGLKAQNNLTYIFKRNISIVYSYYDEDEYEIMQITVRRNDLGI